MHGIQDQSGFSGDLVGAEVMRLETEILLLFSCSIIRCIGCAEFFQKERYTAGLQVLSEKRNLISAVGRIHLESGVLQDHVEAIREA
ncbi:hypothetical protein D3C73_1406940 [compost metagenome]